jgi:transposase
MHFFYLSQGDAMQVRYIIDLSEEERKTLIELTRSGQLGARKMKRAQILMMADEGFNDEEISSALPTGTATAFRTRRRFVEGGIDNALNDRPRPGAKRKLKAKHEATLIAIACSEPPTGSSRWTLELLAGELIRLTNLEDVSRETIRRRLHEKEIKPWQKKMWCIPSVDADFVAHMEDILDLYEAPHKPEEPLVCFDEKMVQLVQETRPQKPVKPGNAMIYDYEYKRNGTANIFLFFDPARKWRHPKVTERRTSVDFAECMRDLVDKHYPAASRIRVVLDNLNTHRAASLYEAFLPEEARRILRRLEFHYTPKHASWLNMVEIENGIMQSQCLARRIPDKTTLAREVNAWANRRNEEGRTTKWLFSLDNAREKFAKVYQSKSL